MSMNRRDFLNTSAAAVTLSATLANAFSAPQTSAVSSKLTRDKMKLLDLPEGFHYRIVDKLHEPMDDGYGSPGLPDGMACFDIDAHTFALMRNHELSPLQKRFSIVHPGKAIPEESYDKSCYGGVSRILFDKKSFKVLRKNMVLTGTYLNCAGGPSPWGWLSCEETTEPNHGFVFLCDPKAAKLQKPHKIAGYGRFRHEAVAIDPRTHIAYLTEDMIDASFYRFVPKHKDRPFEGRFQALAIKNQPKLLTSKNLLPGQAVEVEWLDVENPTPTDDTVRYQAQEKGAALFARGEGVWFHQNSVYFCATIGGPRERGQIFRLDIGTNGRDILQIVAQADQSNDLDMPDNITLSSWGDAYIAEDGNGANYIRVLKPNGELFDFAKNVGAPSEFCGVCFDPSEKVLFVNLQNVHKTLMIEGPFRKFAMG